MKSIMTPLKAIRAKCLDCCGGSYKEVKHCPIKDCPLRPYRMGRRPRVSATTRQKEFKEAALRRYRNDGRSRKKHKKNRHNSGTHRQRDRKE